MVEHAAVNRGVVGSSPTSGAKTLYNQEVRDGFRLKTVLTFLIALTGGGRELAPASSGTAMASSTE
jgi:hypothetical protein